MIAIDSGIDSDIDSASVDTERLPALIELGSRRGASARLDSMLAWHEQMRSELERILLRSGAILFRDFPVRSPEEFARVARAFSSGDLIEEYVPGVSQRTKLGGGVFSSTEYPSHLIMPCHNEMSYTRDWPSKIFFWCAVAPHEQGETPLVDLRRVVKRLSPETAARFREHAVTHSRFFHCGDGSGELARNVRTLDASGYPYTLSWQYAFCTTDKGAVEEEGKRIGASFRWTAEDGLVWRETLPAIRRHRESGEEAWFNQIANFHPVRMKRELRASIPEDQYPRNVFFEDGSPISEAMFEEIRACMASAELCFPWRPNDLLMIDNQSVAHGRRSYQGPRRILAAMAR
jgi:alpha-ketoglutarate-dependent taurine dioxygenase